MRRAFWLVLAIIAAWVAYKLVDAAQAGAFTEKEQLHLLGQLVIYGPCATIVLWLLVVAVREFRDTGDWTAWIPLLALLVLVGGVWSWFGYFMDHGAFYVWPVIVATVLMVLILVRFLALDRRRKAYGDELRKDFPDPPNKDAGPADVRDFKDWK